MNSYQLASIFILYTLTIVCFWLPYKNENKTTGKSVALLLGVVITLIIGLNLDFLAIFILPVILVFQIIFIVFWIFRLYGKRKSGTIVASILTIAFLLFCLYPWISDWLFNKKDVRNVLAFHKIELVEDFKLMKNESGGFRDYYEMFTIKLTDRDFDNLTLKIKTAKNFRGLVTNDLQLSDENYKHHDTLDFETENFVQREYTSNRKTESGTYHFIFQLDKKSKELNYIGSDE